MNRSLILIAFLSTMLHFDAFSQSPAEAVKQEILKDDSLFWIAYNNCNMEGMGRFLSKDVEFYHDKGGVQLGSDMLLTTMKNNLCSNDKFHLRREAVKGSIEIYLMQKSDSIYGVILSGKHLFYITDSSKPERLSGLARFTHLWLLKDGRWTMHRILSYDHGPAPYVNTKKEITLKPALLKQFAGKYKGGIPDTLNIEVQGPLLQLVVGKNTYILHPLSDHVFFQMERDLELEFVKNAQGKITQLLVRENGKQVEAAERVK